MNTSIAPIECDGSKSEQYMKGWNDCVAALRGAHAKAEPHSASMYGFPSIVPGTVNIDPHGVHAYGAVAQQLPDLPSNEDRAGLNMASNPSVESALPSANSAFEGGAEATLFTIAPREAAQEPALPWQPIAELPSSDDLFWFLRGDVVDGPRPPQQGGYDADDWDFFAPCEAPPILTAPQQREGASEFPPMPKATTFLVCRGSDVTARAWTIDQMRDYARAAVAAMSNPQHPSEVVAALRRFIETTEDEGTTDLGRPMLDALVALGYLTKSKRNWWEITERGEQVANAQQAPLRPVTDDSENHKLDTDTHVFFYEQDFYVLSNFSSFSVRWGGLNFPTSEHAYHWEKFRLPVEGESDDDRFQRTSLANSVWQAPSAHEAFKTAERWKRMRRPDWDAVKFDVMRGIIRAKVDQHEYVRRKLLATGERILVEDSWRDDVWGWGPSRDGQNMLGKLWMEVRDELRNECSRLAGESA